MKKLSPKTTAKNYVNADEFVATWTLSSSAGEVAEILGIPVKSARSRAAYYRKRGVNLKKMS